MKALHKSVYFSVGSGLPICAGSSKGKSWRLSKAVWSLMKACVGILKTFLGLSASILTTVYGVLFSPDGISFLLFLSIGPAFLALLVVPLLNHVPYLEENETKHGTRWLPTGSIYAPGLDRLISSVED